MRDAACAMAGSIDSADRSAHARGPPAALRRVIHTDATAERCKRPEEGQWRLAGGTIPRPGAGT